MATNALQPGHRGAISLVSWCPTVSSVWPGASGRCAQSRVGGSEARCVNGSFNIRTRQGGYEQVRHGARTDATM
eukprot:6569590-Prymnesium_polylepis.1